MDCPVCQHSNISAFATVCPNCDSDLVQFTLLDSIEEGYVDNIKQKIANEGDLVAMEKQFKDELSASKSKVNWMLLLMMLMPLIYFTCGKRTVPTEAKIMEATANISKEELATYTANTKRLEAEITKLKSQSLHIEKVRYVIRKGDNLYDIGTMFFDDPLIWKQVMKDNGITNSKKLMPGDTIFLNLKTAQ